MDNNKKYYLIFDFECIQYVNNTYRFPKNNFWKYIFDDNCDKQYAIYQIGYLLIDENYKIIEKECIDVNPRIGMNIILPTTSQPWFWTDKDTKNNMENQNKYFNLPNDFIFIYRQLKTLIDKYHPIIINQGLDCDFRYFNHDCKRYKLPFLYIEGYDLVAFTNNIKKDFNLDIPKNIRPSLSAVLNKNAYMASGLEHLAKYLGIEMVGGQVHNGLFDCELVLKVLKEYCMMCNVDINEFIAKYYDRVGLINNKKRLNKYSLSLNLEGVDHSYIYILPSNYHDIVWNISSEYGENNNVIVNSIIESNCEQYLQLKDNNILLSDGLDSNNNNLYQFVVSLSLTHDGTVEKNDCTKYFIVDNTFSLPENEENAESETKPYVITKNKRRMYILPKDYCNIQYDILMKLKQVNDDDENETFSDAIFTIDASESNCHEYLNIKNNKLILNSGLQINRLYYFTITTNLVKQDFNPSEVSVKYYFMIKKQVKYKSLNT